MHKGPVIVGFDGSPAAVRAMQATASLLGSRAALVVVVWEAGRAFELAAMPGKPLELPPAMLDIRTAVEAEKAAYQDAQRMAEHGAALAREAGLNAEGLVVADDVTVGDTLIRLARELDAQAVVIGAHQHRGLTKLVHGGTLAALANGAPCPVIACGEPHPPDAG
jgi:nucleotide-binding universal stress UspA family protein